MRRVFVCSPFSAEDPAVRAANLRRAQALCREVALRGDAPFAPHLLYPEFLEEASPAERAMGIACGLRWLRTADLLLAVGEPTAGMRVEIEEARRLGIPVVRGRAG